ncbi:wall-associated receptor kinase 2-like [Phoenix dactylifera]|uniref:Wall-associated receptor kinase 2-like n=1 Tax=Phoenix dactylifera TaxID=42345 RepID=A0A8B7BXP7_PHODC|nr:wall-associated receptor kinase 2-like [Phoenix dactylifera]
MQSLNSRGMASMPVFLLQLQLLLLLGTAAVASAITSLPGCEERCGNISIPYPFGMGPGCFMEGFEVTCNGSKPFLGGRIELIDVDVPQGLAHAYWYISWTCYNNSSSNFTGNTARQMDLRGTPFKFSYDRNKFTTIGCNALAYILSSNGQSYASGCLATCSDISSIINGSCNGMGCCQTSIPKGFVFYNSVIDPRFNNSSVYQVYPCSYSFLADETWYQFMASDIISFDFYKRNKNGVPVALDWAVGGTSCEKAKLNTTSYLCLREHSECIDSPNGPGYYCSCSAGYEGNPYLTGGCQDVNECELPEQYPCYGTCLNSLGSYTCKCPEGTHGNALIEAGCIRDKSVLGTILITAGGVGAGIILLLGSSVLIWRGLKERNAKKRKKRFFHENKGLLLQQLVSSDETLVERMKIFTLEELEKATNNFDRARVVGKGGHGTVYKGILSDQRVVAIKKSKIANRIELDQFINEMVILSQINHRNVVKLFGCCLESKVPLLVYEFISGGTLFNHLHDSHHFAPLSWQDRLRIAAEIASALSYLHSAASISIFHRDVKSSNVLLNESYTAKISDFGASRSIPLNRTCVTTAVQGTYGYLDPQYHQTGQLTEKSDVYSFGVILLELLTGKDPISYSRHQEGTLTLDFICSLRENHLFDILDPHILEEGGEEDIEIVAHLTELCLRLNGEERPTMREVEQKLDTMRRFAKSKHDFDVSQNGGMTTGLPSKIPVEGNASGTTSQYSLEKEFMLSLVEQPR